MQKPVGWISSGGGGGGVTKNVSDTTSVFSRVSIRARAFMSGPRAGKTVQLHSGDKQ